VLRPRRETRRPVEPSSTVWEKSFMGLLFLSTMGIGMQPPDSQIILDNSW
jgi:hypothetical protein